MHCPHRVDLVRDELESQGRGRYDEKELWQAVGRVAWKDEEIHPLGHLSSYGFWSTGVLLAELAIICQVARQIMVSKLRRHEVGIFLHGKDYIPYTKEVGVPHL